MWTVKENDRGRLLVVSKTGRLIAQVFTGKSITPDGHVFNSASDLPLVEAENWAAQFAHAPEMRSIIEKLSTLTSKPFMLNELLALVDDGRRVLAEIDASLRKDRE